MRSPRLLGFSFFLFAAGIMLAQEGHLWEQLEAPGVTPPLKEFAKAEDWLRGVTFEPVQLPGHSFHVETRKDKLQQRPCNVCHENAFRASPQGFPGGKDAKAHEHLRMAHASAEVMSCTTCHVPEKGGELHSLKGDGIAFNHSYRVCAACHMGQFKDWQIGAHGKRIGNWTGTRVVRNCTGCHDPHRPAIPGKRHVVSVKHPDTWERRK